MILRSGSYHQPYPTSYKIMTRPYKCFKEWPGVSFLYDAARNIHFGLLFFHFFFSLEESLLGSVNTQELNLVYGAIAIDITW